MKLKLDENLGEQCRRLLADAGHDVATVHDQALTSAADTELIAVCAAEGRCLVTLDMDFANPFSFPPDQHSGIAVLRLPRRPGIRDIIAVAQKLIAALGQRPIVGELWIIERHRLRVYSPPDE